MNTALNSLPETIARQRLLNSEQTAEFIGCSIYEIRRLLGLGQFPKPIRLNGRRMSWRIGDLIDWIDSKAKGEASQPTAKQEVEGCIQSIGRVAEAVAAGRLDRQAVLTRLHDAVAATGLVGAA